MTAIRLEAIQKSFGKGAPVFSGLDLSIAAGEFLSIVGPSGAGKTTLLRLIAGLEAAEAGRIFLGDREVTKAPPEERDIAFVFQSHALYPNLTVEENLAFPLRLRGVGGAEIAERVRATAELLHIAAFLKRRPAELSGGEAQRVALGRALIRQPAALLMDEPLSSLPPDLRFRLRNELQRVHARERRTMLYVTHDHEDALALGQRVAVLNGGRIQQIGTPREIYERPANQFVAGFVGRPAMNFVPSEFLRMPCAPATVGVRPEHLEICEAANAQLIGMVQNVHYLGGTSDIVVSAEGRELIVRCVRLQEVKAGAPIHLRAGREHLHLFDLKTGVRIEA